VGFGGDACLGANAGIGLVLVFGAIAGYGFVAVAANLDIV
jgi:hypothetical protein